MFYMKPDFAVSRPMFSIKSGFGTHRGLIRTVLDTCLWYGGKYRSFALIDWARVGRIIFICQGNICRSPFAAAVASHVFQNMSICSVGLSATAGTPAFVMAQDTARNFALDLSQHRATDIKEFEFRDGDLIVAMEARHIAPLHSLCLGRNVQIALLGLWCRPRLALLYDPYGMSAEYFVTCFDRIHRAVTRMGKEASQIDTGPRSSAVNRAATRISAASG